MKITKREITIAEIASGYIDNEEEGVKGYNGLLNIRPPYQREFVYKDKQREAVITTVRKGFPLNVMYWAKNDDNTYEVLDGQQRTISFCQYVSGVYSINDKYFHTLTNAEQEQILNYKVDIYICEGNDKERLDWFETINIAGERLTRQELLNINYTGEWLADAKRKFSKTNCVAYKLASKYLKGSPIRQEYLETALSWISKGEIAGYMNEHCKDSDANELWHYFTSVINWVKNSFKVYRKEMCGIDWGRLYDTYHHIDYDPDALEAKVAYFMSNEEVTDKKGIYEYVLSGESSELARRLSRRAFSDKEKRTVYEQQKGICPVCGEWHPYEEMEGDHKVAWWRGGTTTMDNLQMLCKKCNNRKAGF